MESSDTTMSTALVPVHTLRGGPSMNVKLQRMVLWSVALLLGAADAWASRATMYPDGVSYLDLGDALWRGDWHNAISGYWSPIYPAALGLVIKVLKPSVYGEYPLVHLVNFLIYVVALICFEIFLRTFIQRQIRDADSTAPSEVGLPLWAWYVAGYSIFISSSLFLITTSFVSGDMAVAAVVYLAFALILKIRAANPSWKAFALLGSLLGIGYLTKTVMLLMGIPFIVGAAFAQPNRSRSLKFAAVAALFFALIAGPFVVALSLQKGRPTFGDSGRINYVINVSRGQFYIPREPDAKHPVPELPVMLDAYEYASPIAGTYPLWYDPSFWHEGIHPHFSFKLQIRAIALSLASCGWILFNPFLGLHITVAVLVLYLIAPAPSICVSRLRAHWPLWVPALSGIGLYCLVVIETRYVGALFCVLWIVGLSGARFPASSRRIVSAVVCLLAAATLAIAGRQVFSESHGADFGERQIATPIIPAAAAALRSAGLKKGDKLALVSDWLFPARQGAYIIRLVRARIIGEVRPEQFWAASAETRAKLIAAYGRAGAKAMFTYRPPRVDPGWEKLEKTDYYVYFIREQHNGVEQ